MKNIYILLIVITSILVSCENQPFETDNFKYQTVYFPQQLPLRTLSLGEDRVDNSLDREFKFDIGVSIGGIVENNKSWTVDYIVDPSLTVNVFNSISKLPIFALPSDYYTLSPANTAIIPPGTVNGTIRVQLTEGFFDDPLSITGQYVIPLKITGTSADSVLSGYPLVSNPDPRIIEHWSMNKSPKNWVMYGIKYVNAYHGSYLHRGSDISYSDETPVKTVVWRQPHVELDAIIKLNTIGKTIVKSNNIGNNTGGLYSMELHFENSVGNPGNITIEPSAGSVYSVTGTGKYFNKETSAEIVIESKMQSLHLSYTYNDGVYIHKVNDSLVFRDRGIKFENNSILVAP